MSVKYVTVTYEVSVDGTQQDGNISSGIWELS